MKHHPVLSLGLLLSLTLIIVSCNPSVAASPDAAAQPTVRPTPTEPANPLVTVAVAEMGDIALVFSYSGNLKPKDEIDLVPGVSGRIERVFVEEGDRVEAGDTLAIIEADTYQAQVKQAEAALEQARLALVEMELGSRSEEIAAAQAAVTLAQANLNDVATVNSNERTQAAAALAQAQAALQVAQTEYDKIAWADDVGSTPQALALQEATIAYENALASYNLQTNPGDAILAPLMLQVALAERDLALLLRPFREVDFAQAQASITQAEAALEAAQLLVDKTIIEAPFDGAVDTLDIAVGSWVNQERPIGTFISAELEAELEVQESRISQVQIGQPATLRFTAYPTQEFAGVVTSVSASANAETRTFTVKVTLAERDDQLRAGMFADIAIVTQESSNAVLIPSQALVQDDPVSVFVVNADNSVAKRAVTVGVQNDQQAQILQGLEDSDLVVIVGQNNLQDGVTAEVVNDPRVGD